MKKLLLPLLVCVILVFPEQTARTDNGIQVMLNDDGSFVPVVLPREAEMKMLPFAMTEDSQLVLLHKGQWEYISPEDTIGGKYDTITINVVPYSLLDEPPLLTYLPRPEYPTGARAKGHEGAVVLKALIDTAGEVSDLEILRSSGYMELDQAAIRVAWKARCTPATYDGRHVRTYMAIPIRFELRR